MLVKYFRILLLPSKHLFRFFYFLAQISTFYDLWQKHLTEFKHAYLKVNWNVDIFLHKLFRFLMNFCQAKIKGEL